MRFSKIFIHFSLDNTDVDERISHDVSEYISARIHAPHPQSSNNSTNSWRKNISSETLDRLSKFLTIRAKGCFLYVKLILDLIEKGTLNIKSSSFKSLPQSLSEIYHLAFSILFPTGQSYETICHILSIALVQLQPVNLESLFDKFSALQIRPEMSWNDFQDKFQLLSDYLVTRQAELATGFLRIY